jgi:DNA repair ATPase RecN
MIKRLRSLGSSNNISILILWETGAGKSTFINALVNCLEFATLDDALASEVLQWVISCSFSTQFINRANPNNEIEEHFVKVWSRDYEKDGSNGDSATQQTTVYL